MTSPSHAEILQKVYERLTGDTILMTLLSNKVFNHVPQDTEVPILRFRWEQASEWDTKDSSGFEGFVTFDIWTEYRGDKLAMEISDRVEAIMHLAPLPLTSGQSLIMRHDLFNRFTEPDGVTHHTVVRYKHIATT